VRITHVITEAWAMGGAQLNTFYSLRYQQADTDVELVVGGDGPLIGVCEEAGIPVRVIPMANRVFAPHADLRSLVGLFLHFRRTRPDVVHTHSSKAGALGRVAARVAGVPIVVHTFHAPSFHSGQPRHVYWPLRLTERLCAPLTDQLIAVSVTTAKEFSDAGVCRPDQVKVVVSGIDFTRFPARPFPGREEIRASLGVEPADPLVVSVGHLSERKAHDVLVDAAAILSDSHPDARFTIVGTGPLEGALRERISRSGLEDRVILTGDRGDIPELLASADIFVQTSRLEGLSRSLVEALYSGLAVVATDVGGTREVVREGETGFLISPGSASELTAALDRLLGNQELRGRLGRSGRAAVVGDRSVEAMGRALDEIYDDLACRKAIRGIPDPGSPHIVYVINSLIAGGAEAHVVRVAVGLKQRGWDVSIFCLSRHGALIERAEAGGVRVVGPVSCESRSSARLLRAVVPLYRYLRRTRPDVVATYLKASDILGSATARLARVQHVVTSRRSVHEYHGLKLFLYRLATFVSDHGSDRVIAVSDGAKRRAIAEGTPPDMVETVYNSVRLPQETGRVAGSFPGSPVIGTVGNLHPAKGHRTLVEALPALVAKLPRARIVLVGQGAEGAILERRALELGVSDHISFLGQRLDVPSLLRQFDLFVFPSLSEGMPNALLEAMAAGLPVVASGVGGILEVVSHGENGLLVPPACPDSLTEAIVRLWSDPDQRRRLGLAARRSVAQRFGSVDREVAETESVYLRLLGHPTPKRYPTEHRTPAPKGRLTEHPGGPAESSDGKAVTGYGVPVTGQGPTRNPKPRARNPQPATRNPQRAIERV
jgi:glycosyltransferase involved in cell wall biosynthesis